MREHPSFLLSVLPKNVHNLKYQVRRARDPLHTFAVEILKDMNGLIEILTNRVWMMDPSRLRGYRTAIESNIHGHVSPGVFAKKKSYAATRTGEELVEYLQTEDGDICRGNAAARIYEPFVDVIMIDGPVTRNGGACSYGSIDHRDLIMAAADNDNCQGHVIYINTPGGSAYAVDDYMQAIEYARAKGQPVYAFIDGLCASAGLYVAAMCDRRFYMHPKNIIGCVGTMAAFYTEKDGGHNEFTDETYHEIYDPESFDKNKAFRDIANDGDSKELIAELTALGAEFRAYVSARCPNVEDKHLHGKVFKAAEVEGILVDEQSTFADVVALCFENVSAKDNNSSTQNMENKYQNVANACGVDSLVVDADGTHLSVDLLDNLSAHLDQIKVVADQLATIGDAHAQEIAGLCQSHSDEIFSLNEQHAAEIAGLKAENKQLEVQLAEARQTITDRDATIEELTRQAAETPDTPPATNGTGAVSQSVGSMPAYDSRLSPEENQRIREDWKRKHYV